MSNPNMLTRKKQTLFAGVLVVAVIGASVIVTAVKKNADQSSQPIMESQRDQEIVTRRFNAVKSGVDERDVWMAESSIQIDQLKEENQALSRTIESMRRDFEQNLRSTLNETRREFQDEVRRIEVERARAEREAANRASRPDAGSSLIASERQVDSAGDIRPTVPGSNINQRGVVNSPLVEHRSAGGSLADYHGEDLAPPRPPRPELSSLSFDRSVHSKTEEVVKTEDVVKPDENVRRADNYIPSGSFVRSLLLGGVDAPTGGQSQQNPHPVLIKVDDLAQLPNNLRFDVKSCHIIAAAHGDISSERAIMRLESMSCIDQNNVVYESNVRGFVFGEDGKAGVRGRVVTKEGQMLMNSLIAGIGAGIGQAFQQQAMTYSTSPLGTTSVIDPDQIVAAGLGTGVGTALDRLSRYYINLAEQLFPVIEVDAGRAVDVVFTSGFSFDRVEPMAQSNTFNQTINQAIGGDYLTDLVETGRRAAENIQKFGIQ